MDKAWHSFEEVPYFFCIHPYNFNIISSFSKISKLVAAIKSLRLALFVKLLWQIQTCMIFKESCTWILSYSVRIYYQTSDISHPFIGNTIVDHSFNYIVIQLIGKRQLQDETANIQVLVYLVYFGIFYTRGLMVKSWFRQGSPMVPLVFIGQL